MKLKIRILMAVKTELGGKPQVRQLADLPITIPANTPWLEVSDAIMDAAEEAMERFRQLNGGSKMWLTWKLITIL